MRYERPKPGEREVQPNEFSEGTHVATIKKISPKPSSKGNKMFTFFLEGTNGEQGKFFLSFGNDFTERNLNFLLSSVEDNGVEIPEMEFGHNRETMNFLLNKDVYIRVEEGSFNGEKQMKITEFLTQLEFEESEEIVSEKDSDDDNSYFD